MIFRRMIVLYSKLKFGFGSSRYDFEVVIVRDFYKLLFLLQYFDIIVALQLSKMSVSKPAS